jgi:hypothetical protein
MLVQFELHKLNGITQMKYFFGQQDYILQGSLMPLSFFQIYQLLFIYVTLPSVSHCIMV